MGKRRIRNFLIKRRFQLTITAKIVLPAFFLSILSALIVFVIVWRVVVGFIPPNFLPFIRTVMTAGLLVGGTGVILLLMAWGIIVTHRIAGPLYRIEQDLTRVLHAEKISPIKLRNGDEFQELVALINQLIAQYTQEQQKK